MELWIRNQDKTLLAKVDRIVLEDFDNCKPKIYSNDDFLGEYATKERALEVLDEIQKLLEPQLIVKDSGKIIGSFEDTIIREGATYELKELSTYVYEMPLD